MSDKVYQIKCEYQFDSYLMHLIQEVTKRPPAEILAFFHELATQIAEIGVKNKAGHGIAKKLVDYFPGTSIPFHIQVNGRPQWRGYNEQLESHVEMFSCHVEVGFPECRTYMKEETLKELSVLLMEKSLLGGGDVIVPDFQRPEIRTPKMFVPLMDAFAGRPVTEPKRKKRKNKDE